MKKSVIIFCFLTSVLFFSSSAYGTIVPQMGWDRLVSESSYIFLGTVVDVSFIEDDDYPEMEVTFSVEDELMGNYDSELVIRIRGGFYPNEDFYYIVGAPQYIEGKTYLSFFKDGEWYLTPSTNWWHSSLRKEIINEQEYFVNDEGHCVMSMAEDKGFVFGPRVENEVEVFFGYKVMRPELSPSEIEDNLAYCMSFDDVNNAVRSSLPLYTSYVPNLYLQSSLSGGLPGGTPLHNIPSENISFDEPDFDVEGDPLQDESEHEEDDY